MMYEGEDVNTIDLLFEGPTKEGNGVKIIIPVKYSDKNEFVKKIKEQLCYFENVYFDVESTYGYQTTPEIDNSFTIYRGKDFQISEICQDHNLHICLDNVYYPLDFQKLGIAPISASVALRFSLTDGLFPTPNRESLRYTTESKEAILKKLESFSDYCMIEYNKTISSTVANIKEILRYFQLKNRNVVIDEKFTIDAALFKSFSKIDLVFPVLPGINTLNLLETINKINYALGEYSKKFILANGSFRDITKGSWSNNLAIYEFLDRTCYIYKDSLSGLKKAYFREIVGGNQVFFIKKTKTFELGDKKSVGMETYYEILNLRSHPKSEWRTRIKELRMIIDMMISTMIDVDTFVIPEDWLEARKKQSVKISRKGMKLKGDVNLKIAERLEKYSMTSYCKFVPTILKLEEFSSYNGLTLYTTHEESSKINPLFNLFSRQKMRFVTFSNREKNIVESAEIHNLISYEKFMEGKNKPFKRLVTSYLIYKIISKNPYLFSQRNRLTGISESLKQKLNLLDDYYKKNYVKVYNLEERIYESMVTVAEQHNLFDLEIHHVVKEVEELTKKMPFVDVILSKLGADATPMLEILVSMFKYNRFKLDAHHYEFKLDANSETVEEDIEQLTN